MSARVGSIGLPNTKRSAVLDEVAIPILDASRVQVPSALPRARQRTSDATPAIHAGPALASRECMTTYTCPMHPEVLSDRPTACSKCGMKLEPTDEQRKTSTHDGHKRPTREQ
jgi:hypothetical protein